MKQQFNFLSLQVDYWDSPWQNRHGLMWELSKNNRVFFLSPPFYLVNLVRGFGASRTALHDISLIKENLYSYVPPRYLPYNYRFPKLDNLIRNLRNNKIRGKLKELEFNRPILYIWHPNYVDMIGEFGESLVIYHKYDNYAGYTGGMNEPDPRERKLFELADLVFVTSKGLYDLHKNDCKDIHLVPNGVDYPFFYKALSDEVEIPDDLEGIPEPRIGYVGVINEKVDFELLTFLCRSHPDWSIVLVGPVKVQVGKFKENLRQLQEQKNCFFLGQKNIQQVPAYIKGLDVCMMCYLINDWTYYGYPLKMHEYLACGKPTVSVDLPAVLEFEGVVSIAKSHEKWASVIEVLLGEKEPSKLTGRLRVAQENSWEERVNTIIEIILKKLA